MSYYSNPTANAAMGAVDKEIGRINKEVKKLKTQKRDGLITEGDFDRKVEKLRCRYKGFYRRVLENALVRKTDEKEEEQ
ncbi:MAG: hypothetical protein IJ017_03310 [Oscillospiraceae bacterium]|nr:hypothetical protein [Oscillospiraceae bacterium]